jgi:hypothetical protein
VFTYLAKAMPSDGTAGDAIDGKEFFQRRLETDRAAAFLVKACLTRIYAKHD